MCLKFFLNFHYKTCHTPEIKGCHAPFLWLWELQLDVSHKLYTVYCHLQYIHKNQASMADKKTQVKPCPGEKNPTRMAEKRALESPGETELSQLDQ